MKRFVKKILFSFLLLLGLLLIFELICRILSTPESQNKYFVKYHELLPSIDSNTILFLGDSRVEWGLNASQIAEPFHGVNLAMPGSNGLDVLTYIVESNKYPKVVIVNYTPFAHDYSNFGADKMKYNLSNYLKTQIDYFLLNNTFFYNQKKLTILMKSQEPYMTDHQYNESGDVVMVLNPNFGGRNKFQIDQYKNKREKFEYDDHDEYLKIISNFQSKFTSHHSRIIGVYLPVCDAINEIEKVCLNEKEVRRSFHGHFYNYSELYDSLLTKDVYLDCAHLNEAYNIEFTNFLIDSCLK